MCVSSISLHQHQAVTMSISLVDESLPPDDVFSHGPLCQIHGNWFQKYLQFTLGDTMWILPYYLA